MENKENVESQGYTESGSSVVIKPCPFCGKLPSIVSKAEGTENEIHWITHSQARDKCNMKVIITPESKSKDEVINFLNQRAL